MLNQFHVFVRNSVQFLQKFIDRVWYPPLIGLLATLDNFLVVIPNDGILISSSMLVPKRWFAYAFFVAIGSTVGAALLAFFVSTQGLPWILEMYPGIDNSSAWSLTQNFFNQYGLLLVFAVAATPFVQQPAIILAVLADTPITEIALVIFIGRFFKFLVMAYVAAKAPRFLSKLWGVRGELEEVGIKVDQSSSR